MLTHIVCFYAVNPQHVPVAQNGASLCEQIVAVDFE